MQLSIKWAAWAAAAFISYQVVQACGEISDSWDVKIKQQRQNFYAVSTSRDKWRELADFRSAWDKLFDREDTASNSRHSLYKQLNVGGDLIQPTVSRIINSETTGVDVDGVPVGISKTCVQNETNGFALKSGSVRDMQAGLTALERRREIVFSDLTLTNHDGKPQVIIRDLCVFFRTGAGESA